MLLGHLSSPGLSPGGFSSQSAVKPGPCPRQRVGAVLGQIIGFPPMSQTWIFGLDVTPIVSAC